MIAQRETRDVSVTVGSEARQRCDLVPSDLPRPKRRQLEVQLLERRNARRLGAAPGAEQLVTRSREREGFEGLQAWVDRPDVRHVLTVQLGFVENDPTARAATAAVEGVAEHHTEQRSDGSVWPARARLRVELTTDDLANDVVRQREEIVVGSAARGDVCYALPSPKALQIELDCFKWLGAHDVVAAVSYQEYPVVAVEAVGFEGLVEGVEEPEVRDTGASVERELFGAVEAAGRGREDFAYPVGSKGQEALARERRQALSPPTGDVGYDHVFGQVKLGLLQNPPAAGAAVTKLHARKQRGAERGRARGVGNGGSRADVQLARYQLSHQMLWQRDEVVVGRGSPSGQRHASKVARRRGASGSTRACGDRSVTREWISQEGR